MCTKILAFQMPKCVHTPPSRRFQSSNPQGKAILETEAVVGAWQFLASWSWLRTDQELDLDLRCIKGCIKVQTARKSPVNNSVSRKGLFWIESEPKVNPKSGVADNIHATPSMAPSQCPCNGYTQRDWCLAMAQISLWQSQQRATEMGACDG